MADHDLVMPTRHSPEEIWSISVESVLQAAQLVSHSAKPPPLITPISRVLPDDLSRMRYLGDLQDILANKHGFTVDFADNPPIALADMGAKKFEDLVYAVEDRLLKLAL